MSARSPKKKRCRTEGLEVLHLEVLNLCGKCMLTLHVAGSMLGRVFFWEHDFGEKVPSKPVGRELVDVYTRAFKTRGLDSPLGIGFPYRDDAH